MALDRIRRGEAEGLVALKLGRISRSVRDVLALADDAQRRGWRLVSVSEALDTGSATGRFTLTILAALAQLEREEVAERSRFALDAIAPSGRLRSHRTPFGLKLADGRTAGRAGEKGELVEDATEQEIRKCSSEPVWPQGVRSVTLAGDGGAANATPRAARAAG